MSETGTCRPVAAGWHGKLPSRGDFVGQGLPAAWLATWDRWLEAALADAATELGSPTLRRRLLAMAPWQFMVPPTTPGEAVWCGVAVPSADRVGRAYPLLLAEAYEEATIAGAALVALHERALALADWLDRIGTLATPEAFDAGVAMWLATAWPAGGDSDTVADLRRAQPQAGSFWWRPEPLDGLAPAQAEDWPPRLALLKEWLRD